jgi:hypothetical protein
MPYGDENLVLHGEWIWFVNKRVSYSDDQWGMYR